MTDLDLVLEDTKEIVASNLFEIASEQRISIMLDLFEENTTISKMAKKLDATVPEVFRNFTRLSKAGFIQKNSDGDYSLTTKGRTICNQIPSIVFMAKNESYFKDHTFGNLPQKFIQRIAALNATQHLQGYVKVMECWQEIYSNAQSYIYNILSEVPYTEEITKPLLEKLKGEVSVRSIFLEKAVVSKERKKIFQKEGFQKFIQEGKVKRKMTKDVKIALIMNEKEAAIMFPKGEEPDMSRIFYGDDKEFHEWCMDYFNQCWDKAASFQEKKLEA